MNEIKTNNIYTCPMHSEIEQPFPGDCPISGMALEPKSPTEECYSAEYYDMLHRFSIGSVLAIPVFLLASFLPIQTDLSRWLQLALSTPIVLWVGWPIFQKAWNSFRHHLSLNMFSLISLGIGAACF